MKERMNLTEATKLALQGKLQERKLVESDATPEFLEDLKNLINNHLRVDTIESIQVVDGSDIKDYLKGEDILVITFEAGATKQINVTGDSNLAVVRDVLFALA